MTETVEIAKPRTKTQAKTIESDGFSKIFLKRSIDKFFSMTRRISFVQSNEIRLSISSRKTMTQYVFLTHKSKVSAKGCRM